MLNYINIILSFLIIETISDILICKIFKLKCNLFYVLLLQVPKLCAIALCLFYSSSVWVYFLLVLASKILGVFFLTDNFSIKKMSAILFLEFFLMMAVMGFSQFLLLVFKAGVERFFAAKIPKYLTI